MWLQVTPTLTFDVSQPACRCRSLPIPLPLYPWHDSQEKCTRVCAGSKLIMSAVHPERPASSSAAVGCAPQPDPFSWPNAESRRSPVLARRRTARDSLIARRRSRALLPPALRERSHRARLFDRTCVFLPPCLESVMFMASSRASECMVMSVYGTYQLSACRVSCVMSAI